MRWLALSACLVGCSALFGLHSTGDGDRDGDRVPDAIDNCQDVANPDQSDFDGDGTGDACSGCFSPGAPDSDGDGIPDPCDGCDNRAPDDNHDGVPDVCQHLQTMDAMGSTDASDPCPGCSVCPNNPPHDEDGDHIPDGCDLCPSIADTSADGDTDGVGDACDVSSNKDSQVFDPFAVANQAWYVEHGQWLVTNDDLVVSPGTKQASRFLGAAQTSFTATARIRINGQLGSSNAAVIIASSPTLAAGEAWACQVSTASGQLVLLQMIGGAVINTFNVATVDPSMDVDVALIAGTPGPGKLDIGCRASNQAVSTTVSTTVVTWFPGLSAYGFGKSIFGYYDVVTDVP